MTRPPHCRVAVDQPRGRGRDAVALGVRALAALGRGHAGVQDDRRHRDALRRQRGEHRRGERAPGARHLRAAGLGRDRPSGRPTAGARRARSGSGSAHRGGPGRPAAARAAPAGRPRGAPGQVGRLERRAPAARQVAATSPARPPRKGSAPARSSTTQRSSPAPGSGVERRSSSAVPSVRARGQRGRQRGRRVDDQQVAGAQEVGQIARPRVNELPGAARRPACAPRRGPARAPRAARAPRGARAARTRAARSRRDLPMSASPVAAAGPSPSSRASRPGTLSSGGGRSEMSSPGNASWCIAVLMSPGSTA